MIEEPQAIAAILGVLRQRTGIDFSCYREPMVRRRLANRMMSAGAATLRDYFALLRDSDAEAQRLLDRIAIKVSRFYRNAESWDLLRRQVIPRLAAAGTPLALWSAGCGRGEEAWTLAMLLDHAGVEGRVLATDIDPGALEAASEGRYPETSAAELPGELARRYLEPRTRGGVSVRDTLRSRVTFLRHDVLFAEPPARGGFAEPPAPGGFDLVCCRNLLIYLRSGPREEAFGALMRALRPGGCLMLGEAEWPPGAFESRLAPLDRRARLFTANAA
jgi:chemotaxis methyl-accepting protein methylase